MSGVNMYIPAWSFYENFFYDYFYSFLRNFYVYFNYILFSLLKYNSIVTLLLFFLTSRFIINVQILTKYVNSNVLMRHMYSFPSIFGKLLLLFLLTVLILFS